MTVGQLALAIRQAEAAPGMPVKLVAIDGHGGAGKTVLARRLAKELAAEVLHTDDFASWDDPLDWWPQLEEAALKPVRDGARTLSYPRSSWYKNHRPAPVKGQPVTDVMILEGVSAARREFRPYLAYSIWVETPADVCRERGIARDLADNPDGKSRAELEADWRRWHAYEDDYVARDDPRGHADAIVKGDA
jgi:uridine kinase